MKKILVTGANKGIGLGIVKKLLRDFPDTYLLLGSRDVARGEAAVREILSEMGNIILNLEHLDFRTSFHPKQLKVNPLDLDWRWSTLTCVLSPALLGPARMSAPGTESSMVSSTTLEECYPRPKTPSTSTLML